MKNTVKLNESQLKKIVAESVKRVLKEYNSNLDYESNYGEYDFYVAADTNSEYFHTFDEAYDYAKELAMKEKDWYEPIDVMDNREWITIVRFDENGEHDLCSDRYY